MRRLDLWKAKLKAAKAALKIHSRNANAAAKTLQSVQQIINELERKIGDYLAKS